MQKPLVYIIGDIVKKVEASIVSKISATSITYQHGHPKEIIETLQQMDESRTSKFKKFPLIALFQDFEEKMGKSTGFYSEVKLQVIIAQSTDRNYKSRDRYVKNFVPILLPIYDELIQQIALCKQVVQSEVYGIEHTKIERLFWGKQGLYGNEGNLFNDYLDAVEIRDLRLNIYNTNCFNS